MAVHNQRLAAVVGRPVVADRQAEFVGFARRLPIKSEFSHFAGAATLHRFLHASVGHHELAVIEDIVADEVVEELRGFDAELVRLAAQLFDRLRQAVGQLDITSLEGLDELYVVIARNADGLPRVNHSHRQTEDVGSSWTAINEVSDENQGASLRRRDLELRCLTFNRIAEFGH